MIVRTYDHLAMKTFGSHDFPHCASPLLIDFCTLLVFIEHNMLLICYQNSYINNNTHVH